MKVFSRSVLTGLKDLKSDFVKIAFDVTLIINPSHITLWCVLGGKTIHTVLTTAIFNVSDGSEKKLEKKKKSVHMTTSGSNLF